MIFYSFRTAQKTGYPIHTVQSNDDGGNIKTEIRDLKTDGRNNRKSM